MKNAKNHIENEAGENHLEFINGLRGIAILMVVYFHASLLISPSSAFITQRIFLEHLSRGVQLFFIISAFTLFRSYELRKGKEKRAILNFYIRRFFRIIPFWWLTVLLYWVFERGHHTAFDAWATALMFFGFYKEIQAIALIPVGWSLFVEETFYLFFPLVKKFVRNIGTALAGLFVSAWVAKEWISYGVKQGWDAYFVAVFPLANSYALFLGIFLYYVYKWLKKCDYLDRSYKEVWFVDVLIIGSIWGLFHTQRMVGTMLFVPIVLSGFFKNTIFNKFLHNQLLGKFGKYCYSIYLLHPLINSKVYGFFYDYLKSQIVYSSDFYLIIFLVFLFLSSIYYFIGAMSFEWIELRFINLGRKVIRRLEEAR